MGAPIYTYIHTDAAAERLIIDRPGLPVFGLSKYIYTYLEQANSSILYVSNPSEQEPQPLQFKTIHHRDQDDIYQEGKTVQGLRHGREVTPAW